MGQSASFKGKVFGDNEPLYFALVDLNHGNYQVLTDEGGNFSFYHLPEGAYVVKISILGYKPIQDTIILENTELPFQKDYTLIDATLVVSGALRPVSKMESPIAVDVYNATFFQQNPVPSLFEGMHNINGVKPQINCNVCNTGDIHINGLEGPYTMILIDGMPIVSGLSTVYGLMGIPQSLIERIEVVKGPASTLYGSEAVGGLINVITKDVKYAPKLGLDIFTSSWAEVNADLGLKFTLTNKVSSLLGINYFDYNVPFDNNADGFTDVTLQRRLSVFNKFNFKRKSEKDFSIALRYIHENRWGGQMNWTNQFRGTDSIYGESIYTNRWETIGTYALNTKENIKINWSINGHYQDSHYGDIPYKAAQHIAFAQMIWQKDWLKNRLLSGATFRYTHYEDNTTATIVPSHTFLPGIFIQNEWDINKKNILLAGLRYDYNNKHGAIFSPRLNYRFLSENKQTSFRLGLGNGYRVVNVFTEDHAALTGARNVVFNAALKPETSWNINANMVRKFYFDNFIFLNIDFTAFYTYFNNRILPDYDTDPNLIIYDNLKGHAISKGLALNIDLELPINLSINLGATLQDVYTVEQNEKTQQMFAEHFSAVWGLTYTWKKYDWTFNYNGNLYSPMRLPLLSDLDPRSEYSPWWSLQNIQATKRFNNKWQIYFGIKNLLNYTLPKNAIARAHDPFDKNVQFDAQGQVLATSENPYALTFDPSYMFAPNQGIRFFLGCRYTIQ